MALLGRIYRSDFHVDFVGRRRVWYAISGVIIAICAVSMIFRGFTLGIEFSGGAVFQLPSHGGTVQQVEETLSSVGIDPADGVVQQLETSKQFRVQTPTLSDAQTDKLTDALAKRFSVANPDRDIAVSTVGSSWGSTITKKAVQGLVVFLVLVMIYLSVRFEWKMAVAAMAALIHDLVVTMGVYSLVGFEVTPSTVIAVLTILGFSLYDTVVVFDRVRENTAGMATSHRRTYAEATNDALNETLVRSLNTSLIALIPVASLLFVGAGLLGAGTLKDLALAQFVGIASGTYSSLFFATPLLVDLKRGESAVQALDARVARERGKRARAAASASAGPGAPVGSSAPGETASGEVAALAAGAAARPDDPDDPVGRPGGPGAREPVPAGAGLGGPGRRPPTAGAARRAGGRKPGRRGRPSGKKRR
ncbi:protein translocase subunit SecF [Frankia sp. ACN1ag]|uniref:protein translocase subunit SecF n=2 Tax=unclassified Frankia TaxID=2632575 RepID=UPI0006DCC15D|nr:protein translocase subunit SecF [Frankia sp. ACN1ag]KQC39177.1 preprotein translocase subunit SecF [Frankia sp. ACN1ag]KQM07056.1 protein translocase subunit secF [Frankia sp. CpI1-P]